MDFFQGRSPPNYIPFCLDEPLAENDQIPESSPNPSPSQPKAYSPPPFPPLTASSSQLQIGTAASPFSLDSNVDVTAYADELVQRKEGALSGNFQKTRS